MYYWLVVFDCNVNFLTLVELAEVNPVVLLLFKLEAVIELVHLDIVGVIALEDFGKDPTVGQITLWVGDFVGEVK